MKYKITIESINEVEYNETDTRYIDKNTGNPCEYADKNAVRQTYNTGKQLRRIDRDTVYEQTISETEIEIEAIIKAVNGLE